MKQKLAIAGLASPLLIGGCVLMMLFMGTMGWFFFSGGEAEIVKVATVAPFFTIKVADNDSTQAQLAVENVVNEAQPQPQSDAGQQDTPINASANLEADEPSMSPEEIEQQLGFALPVGSVNSITQDGVGSRLVIPKMELDAPIVIAPIENQTWKVEHLTQEIGHLEGTARPGSNSNIVLAAHVTLETGEYGPFAGLGKLVPGDSIYVYDGDQKFEYVIESHDTVDRTAVEVTYPTDTGQLTLITCNNWSADEGRYVERLVVKGHLLN